MVDIVTFLADNNITIDPLFDVLELTAVSADGTAIVGLGRWTDTFELATFRVTLPVVPEPASASIAGLVAMTLLARRRRHAN
ncbi:hypothetical protein BH09PLA1_BH09PLA1_22950 [soil metagenome]